MITALASLAGASIAGGLLGVDKQLGFQCGCEYGNCGCRPIGTPYITPQQPTPLGPTLRPYTPPPRLTPELPNAPTPTLPLFPTYSATTALLPTVAPTWTPFPAPPTATALPSLPLTPTVALPPPFAGGYCPLQISRTNALPGETYRVRWHTFTTSPAPSLSTSLASSIFPQGYNFSQTYWEWLVQLSAPYPPTSFVVTLIVGSESYDCIVVRTP